jgi:ribA/ribD-fused uncharacterized protein
VSNPVLFWGGIYSQWYRSPFEIDGIKYRTAEHYMMACKARTFGDNETLAAILAESDPSKAKALGRLVRGWSDDVWKQVRFQHVCRGSFEKFRQNPDLLWQLVETGDREIVEASPYDKIWGVGLSEDEALKFWKTGQNTIPQPAWPGLNLLGKALMAARTMLTQQ